MPRSPVQLTIGEIARRAEINASAIRYYERHGLLPEPERIGGQRRYDVGVLRRLEVIDIAKQAGLTLSEIRLMLAANDSAAPTHLKLHELAKRKLPEIDALIEHASAVRRWLAAADSCACESLDVCGLFDPGDERTRALTDRPASRK